jgi:glycosyltransferase involved in cell wall biosynthesis
MRILYVTTIGSTMNFFNSFIKVLLEEGHTVDIATNAQTSQVPACYREWGCTIYQIDTSRSPISVGNLKAIKQIRDIVDTNRYDIVHCHTPLAAMSTRFACMKSRRKGTRVLYTAHGFHFYKGAPLKNWLLFYPVEKICARFTDVLITINQEDYIFAKRHLKAKRIEYVSGVGVDLKRFGEVTTEKQIKRSELGIPEDKVLLFSIGELNENKNHETIIRAIANMDVHYMIAGTGKLQVYLQRVIDELMLGDRVKLLGFRNDIGQLCKAADIFVFPSFREGLPVSVIEAMASGLPCVASKIRGNMDLVAAEGGFLCAPDDVHGFANAIKTLSTDMQLCRSMGVFNQSRAKEFDVLVVNKQLKKIYAEDHKKQ